LVGEGGPVEEEYIWIREMTFGVLGQITCPLDAQNR
jgi:hypothetical protein